MPVYYTLFIPGWVNGSFIFSSALQVCPLVGLTAEIAMLTLTIDR
jgi:hypothetical protein